MTAFEPERQSFEHLLDNVKPNSLTNVRAFRLALGERSGEIKLYVGKDLLFSNLIKPRTREMSHQVVQIVAGDEFREEENLPLPRVVKIDVEGYEYLNLLKSLGFSWIDVHRWCGIPELRILAYKEG